MQRLIEKRKRLIDGTSGIFEASYLTQCDCAPVHISYFLGN